MGVISPQLLNNANEFTFFSDQKKFEENLEALVSTSELAQAHAALVNTSEVVQSGAKTAQHAETDARAVSGTGASTGVTPGKSSREREREREPRRSKVEQVVDRMALDTVQRAAAELGVLKNAKLLQRQKRVSRLRVKSSPVDAAGDAAAGAGGDCDTAQQNKSRRSSKASKASAASKSSAATGGSSERARPWISQAALRVLESKLKEKDSTGAVESESGKVDDSG